ncbi:MAG: hypothetical protein DRI75_00675 [Bacteroidetes bacterium]|nr:MAG: hypothetical protein DRI75_00675 [Bacteroidota bacterium]
MFLKRFKKKSNQNYINKILNSRNESVNDNKLKSVGVILNIDEFDEHEDLRLFLKNIGIMENKIKFITFVTEEKFVPNSWDLYFNPKDFGWKGKINSIELQEFINTKFDALISYYKGDNLELNMVTALSKANFKIGISNSDQRLNDFIIDVKPNQIAVFKQETLKYLKVLNKI